MSQEDKKAAEIVDRSRVLTSGEAVWTNDKEDLERDIASALTQARSDEKRVMIERLHVHARRLATRGLRNVATDMIAALERQQRMESK